MSLVLDTTKIKGRANTVSQAEIDVVGKVRLHNVSWETYDRLIAEQADNSSLRLTYDNGDLELMVESFKHGNYSRYLEYIVIEMADLAGIDFVPAGSTTFRKESKKKGFEGNGSFYFKNAESVRGKDEIDLAKDPSPELVIEIDISNDSLPKFPIFAGLGVEEVWRFDGETVKFYRLENSDYKEVAASVCLPSVKSETVTKLLLSAQELKRPEWLKLIRGSVQGG